MALAYVTLSSTASPGVTNAMPIWPLKRPIWPLEANRHSISIIAFTGPLHDVPSSSAARTSQQSRGEGRTDGRHGHQPDLFETARGENTSRCDCSTRAFGNLTTACLLSPTAGGASPSPCIALLRSLAHRHYRCLTTHRQISVRTLPQPFSCRARSTTHRPWAITPTAVPVSSLV
jgi:hypothetical protein